jgi:transcriptional regulator with XRE-family HTH domain
MEVQSTANLGALSDRIRLARTKARMSQAGLARLLAVTASAVSQWENPQGTRPDLASIVGVASVTHVSLDWLLTGNGGGARPAALRAKDSDPAIVLTTFAHDVLEEKLLERFRSIPLHAREHFVWLLEEISSAHGVRFGKRR